MIRIRWRKWRFRLAFFMAAVLMFTTLWTFMTLLIIAATQADPEGGDKETSGGQPSYLRKAGDGQDDYIGHGVQIVVGHYNGKLPEEPKFNLTADEKNANDFKPDPDAGEMGHGIRLSADEEVKSKRSWSINQFNLVASDKIPLNRSLPDVRKKLCQEQKVPPVLPTTSVVIVYHNEAFSTLLRTVTSVIDRSPRAALKEIILVDDKSQREFLRDQLDHYVAQLPVPVVIIRSELRVGLIRARLMGAREATGEVLTFLDSHCECTEGWLQPLLTRISEDRRHVVCPVIDVINDKTFAYQRGLEMFRGGFNWNLQFRWYSAPPAEIKQRAKDPTAPIKSPTMAGGLFSIDKSYFEELGTYDSHMDIWGGENLEMSFRVWQCGGTIEILPCSHVGHIFRKASPHDFPDKKSGEILNTNLVRAAEVWMDDWKHMFYKTAPQALEISKKVDVSERLELRKRLKCEDFRWYLKNVWPEHFLPLPGQFFGRVENPNAEMCLEIAYVSAFSQSGTAKRASMEKCGNGFGRLQLWLITEEGYIKSDEHQCLGATEVSGSWIVQLKECNEGDYEKWEWNEGKNIFLHKKSGLCLDKPANNQPDSTHTPTLKKCSRFSSSQGWKLHPVAWLPASR